MLLCDQIFQCNYKKKKKLLQDYLTKKKKSGKFYKDHEKDYF